MTMFSDEEYYHILDNLLACSTDHLRLIFKRRWKQMENEEWTEDETYRVQFLNKYGKSILAHARDFQKKAIKSKPLEQWDISLLSVVLQSFVTEEKWVQENPAIRKLKDMRNELAHHGSKKIDKCEYENCVETFLSSMSILGMDPEEVDKLVKRSESVSSLKALERVNILFEKAVNLSSSGKNKQADECFLEAMKTPCLQPVMLGLVHEKRAEFHLSLVKHPLLDQEKINVAIHEVEEAIKLNDCSWMSHYLAARCHRLRNELTQAERHYEQALAIYPAQEQVRNDLDSCKVLSGAFTNDNMKAPFSINELIKHYENVTGLVCSKEQFLHLMEYEDLNKAPGQDHLNRGRMHNLGLGVPQNLKEAASHFGKAAGLGNAEAMSAFADCYLNGAGVTQDVGEALGIFKRAAEMDKLSPGLMTPYKCNQGVAEAQLSLGIMYESGIAVDVDYREALKWYEKAMENGNPQAACKLGAMYSKGLGVAKDDKMAELCWLEGVNLKCNAAVVSLIAYYLKELEPDKATHMFNLVKERNVVGICNLSQEEFERVAQAKWRKRVEMEDEVEEFEEAHQLQMKGLTFNQRVCRKSRFSTDIKCLKSQTHSQEPASFTVDLYTALALQGSTIAQKILTAVEFGQKLSNLLEKQSEFTEDEKLQILDFQYETIALGYSVLSLSKSSQRKLKSVFKNLLESGKYSEAGEIDEKVRICFVLFNLSASAPNQNNMLDVRLLQEGIKRYPENSMYYKRLTDILTKKRIHDLAEHYALEGLEKFPQNYELWFSYCKLLDRLVIEQGEECTEALTMKCIGALQNFIAVAPKDHPELPLAYYYICCTYLRKFNCRHAYGKLPKDVVVLVEHYYECGQQAEKLQLPHCLPYTATPKDWVEMILLAEKGETEEEEGRGVEGSQKESVLKRKQYLKSPSRRALILMHRQDLNKSEVNFPKMNNGAGSKVEQKSVIYVGKVKPISLHQMISFSEQIFENRSIKLTILDDPCPINNNNNAIATVVEDENGDVIQLVVRNLKLNQETVAKFEAGCRVTVFNPHIIMGSLGNINFLQNSEPSCIKYGEKVINMCRFCGEENATHECSDCKRPYCSEECEILDWKRMDHKLICFLKQKYANDRAQNGIIISNPLPMTSNMEYVEESAARFNSGIPNIGNSCYMSATIQCLARMEKLVTNILFKVSSNYMANIGRLTRALATVFQQISEGRQYICLRDFKEVMGSYIPTYGTLVQQDAQEFLTKLLELLIQEESASGKDVLSPDSLSRTFSGELIARVVCSSCNKEFVVTELFGVLSLAIPELDGEVSIEDCIQYYTNEEEIQDYDCARCKRKVKATKRVNFDRLPTCIIIHLKRFHFEQLGKTLEKRLTIVKFDHTLNFGCTDMNNDGDNIYHLYSVTNHNGTLDTGHYTAYCRSKTGNWIDCNDEKVEPLNKVKVSSPAAYVLFYEKRDGDME